MKCTFSNAALLLGIAIAASACSGGKDKADGSNSAPKEQINSIYNPSDREKIVNELMIKDDVDTYFNNGESGLDYSMFPFATAKQLRTAYADNEARADKDYKGKKLIVTGTVGSINSGLGDVPYVTIKSGDMFQDPQLSFSRKYRELAIDLNKNQQVTFYCIGNGSVIGTPMLKDCKPVADAADEATQDKIKEINKLYNGNLDVPNEIKQVAFYFRYLSLATEGFAGCEDFSNLKCIKKTIEAKQKISNEEKEEIKKQLQPLADYLRIEIPPTKQ